MPASSAKSPQMEGEWPAAPSPLPIILSWLHPRMLLYSTSQLSPWKASNFTVYSGFYSLFLLLISYPSICDSLLNFNSSVPFPPLTFCFHVSISVTSPPVLAPRPPDTCCHSPGCPLFPISPPPPPPSHWPGFRSCPVSWKPLPPCHLASTLSTTPSPLSPSCQRALLSVIPQLWKLPADCQGNPLTLLTNLLQACPADSYHLPRQSILLWAARPLGRPSGPLPGFDWSYILRAHRQALLPAPQQPPAPHLVHMCSQLSCRTPSPPAATPRLCTAAGLQATPG